MQRAVARVGSPSSLELSTTEPGTETDFEDASELAQGYLSARCCTADSFP